jgi:hypothetical protein
MKALTFFLLIKRLSYLLLIATLAVCCETTQVIYKTPVNRELNKIGIADLNKRSSKLDSLFPKLDSTFKSSTLKYAARFIGKEAMILNEKISCHIPDTFKIRDLCAKHNLDAIILTYIEFTLMINQIYFITTDKYFRCTLYTKVYDKNGKMLYNINHNSKRDEYNTIPTVYDVVGLSVGISYKKINSIRQKK